MVKHLAVFDGEVVKSIFDGKKKIEGRFSKIKIAPFGRVAAGDVVYIKVSGESIVGQFVVDRVFYFDHPKETELLEIKKKYAKELALPVDFWHNREKINYLTLMFIKSVSKFIVAPDVPKKDLRPWVVLD